MAKELSVAIIFKNEIRCLERCLKSLQVLKEHFDCEIVMADTGSDDGSREVAERYADIVFDFPWINDFAAARNAVLDRCSGAWVLVMDCDEWLDEDVDELRSFMHSRGAKECTSAMITVRNYTHPGLTQYGDVLLMRMMRMSAKPRYVGAIHEVPRFPDREVWTELPHTLLHHDGYLVLNDGSEAGKVKRARNVALLREELKEKPEDPMRLMQYIEAAQDEEDYLPTLRRAVALAAEKDTHAWRQVAPAILRTAVYIAQNKDLPEVDEWEDKAQELFPDSYFTRLDVTLMRMMRAIKKEDYAAAAEQGERYLKAFADAERDEDGMAATIRCGILQRFNPHYKQFARIRLMEAYQHLGRFDDIAPLLQQTDWSELDESGVRSLLWLWMQLYISSVIDLAALMPAFWDGITMEKPNAEAAKGRKSTFLREGVVIFGARPDGAGKKVPWQMFLPLRGRCILGDAAAMMQCGTPEEADELLAGVEDITAIPGSALIGALKAGAAFPVPGKPLTVEQADALAARLDRDKAFLRETAIFAAGAAEDDQDILWARALALAAVQSNNWTADNDPQPLLRAFVRAESAFLCRCYAANALRHPEYLPPMHRFALHLANAFSVIAPSAVSPEFTPTAPAGIRSALAELKEAVKAAPEQKAMVDLILDELSATI